jgi:mono/diheme cytochrome c family protein
MNQRWSNLVGRIIVGAVVAVVVAGCGGGGDSKSSSGSDSASAAKGKSIFVEKCGACHTLAAAGTTGQVGPSLDEIMPDEQRVLDQIKNGGGAMPPQLVTGTKAKQVAAYVASAAGH